MSRHRLGLFAGVACAVLIAAGCGDDGGEPTPAATQPSVGDIDLAAVSPELLVRYPAGVVQQGWPHVVTSGDFNGDGAADILLGAPFADGPPDQSRMDAGQAQQILMNLALNARDAMPNGGRLTLSTGGPATGQNAYSHDWVELSVQDTGMGMSAETLDHVFEPFFTTKDVGKGTGLGLSMVYGMARQSGGTARIDSEVGVGTTVSLFFRRAEADGEMPASGGKTGDAVRREQSGASLLLIDDDDDVRSFMAASLVDFGHRVVEAANGADGLRCFAETAPDLVVLDFVMPGLSGAEVAARILANNPDQRILFVSGYSETDAIRDVAPGAPVLAKPFRPDVLDAAVRDALA